ncbi:hypothetical protein [Shewanella sairae]|nr:hypothetical protein [Shewanella sairae]
MQYNAILGFVGWALAHQYTEYSDSLIDEAEGDKADGINAVLQ